jgi:general secretion pathway protein G
LIRRKAFTLVEMVVVVLIMGIIAAVAMPRMTANAQTAKTNSAKQSLATIRNAIEMYKADNGSNPADAATLATVLKPYLKGPFPAAPIGANAGSAAVAVGTDPAAVVTGGAGWAYTASTGDFYLNDASGLTW